MAKFKLLNPVLRVVGQKYNEQGQPSGAMNPNVQNAGKKYVYSQLINLDCPWEGAQIYTSFEPNVIAVFEPLLSIAKGGLAQTDQPIPEMFQTIEGCYVTWKSPQPFYKKHLSAHKANPARGLPEVQAGEIVKQGGVPVVYTELVVFCQYYYDSRNEKQWMRGRTPEEVGRTAFANYCIPVNDTQALAAELQPQPTQEIVGGQVINTVQPQPQPTFTQGPAVQGAAFGV